MKYAVINTVTTTFIAGFNVIELAEKSRAAHLPDVTIFSGTGEIRDQFTEPQMRSIRQKMDGVVRPRQHDKTKAVKDLWKFLEEVPVSEETPGQTVVPLVPKKEKGGPMKFIRERLLQGNGASITNLQDGRYSETTVKTCISCLRNKKYGEPLNIIRRKVAGISFYSAGG